MPKLTLTVSSQQINRHVGYNNDFINTWHNNDFMLGPEGGVTTPGTPPPPPLYPPLPCAMLVTIRIAYVNVGVGTRLQTYKRSCCCDVIRPKNISRRRKSHDVVKFSRRRKSHDVVSLTTS